MWSRPEIYNNGVLIPLFPRSPMTGIFADVVAADMKSSLAAMVVAVEDFLNMHPKPSGRTSAFC